MAANPAIRSALLDDTKRAMITLEEPQESVAQVAESVHKLSPQNWNLWKAIKRLPQDM